MRLWSVHPRYLDAPGLVALWREALLAQKVLKGETRGYKNHPQLERFRRHSQSQRAIASYLMGVWEESQRRGFHFDKRKIDRRGSVGTLTVSRGQLEYEFVLLSMKLKRRSPEECRQPRFSAKVQAHPLFRVVDGGVEEWERIKANVW